MGSAETDVKLTDSQGFKVPPPPPPPLVVPHLGSDGGSDVKAGVTGSQDTASGKMAFVEVTRAPELLSQPELEGQIVETIVGSHVMKHIIDDPPLLDTVLSCQDGKVGAHRCILATASPFMGYLLRGRPSGEVSTIVLPDITVKTMTDVLALCYTGQVVLEKETSDDFYDAINMLMIGLEADFSLSRVKQKKETSAPETPSAPLPATVEENAGNALPVPGPSSACNMEDVPVIAPSLPVNAQAEVENERTESRRPGPEQEEVDKNLTQARKHINGVLLSNGSTFVCFICQGLLPNRHEFLKHLRNIHGKAFQTNEASAQEVSALKKCEICRTQFNQVQKAAECLQKHGFVKCLCCFLILPTAELADHYNQAHGLNTKYSLAAKCRWCDLAVIIGRNCSKPQAHAMTHVNNSLMYTPPVASRNDTFPSHNGTHDLFSSKSGCSKTSNGSSVRGISSTPITVGPASGKTKRNFLTVYEMLTLAPAMKKRKLDENGKPLQLSKKTGAPHKFEIKTVKRRDPRDTPEPPEFFTKPGTDVVEELEIAKLPPIHIYLELADDPTIVKISSDQDSNKNPVPSQEVRKKKSKGFFKLSDHQPLITNFGSGVLSRTPQEDIPYIPPVVDILESGCLTDSDNDEIIEIDASFGTERN